jgi:hypothetical protein
MVARDWSSIDLANKADSPCERGVKTTIGALGVFVQGVCTACRAGASMNCQREIQLERDDPVEVQSWQDYYREKWRS